MSKTYLGDKRMKYNCLTMNIICQMLVYERHTSLELFLLGIIFIDNWHW
jgi:hypothetical protein